MYFIPPEEQLFPEWRIVFVIAFPGEENYYRLIINLEDKEKIESSVDWIHIDEHHFNKNMCESFRFDTEIKDGETWVSYTEDRANDILKKELEAEFKNQVTAEPKFLGIMAGDSIQSGLSEYLQEYLKAANKQKTGR